MHRILWLVGGGIWSSGGDTHGDSRLDHRGCSPDYKRYRSAYRRLARDHARPVVRVSGQVASATARWPGIDMNCGGTATGDDDENDMDQSYPKTLRY